MITRRSFLVQGSGIIVVAGVSAALPGCAAAVRSDFTDMREGRSALGSARGAVGGATGDAAAGSGAEALSALVGTEGMEMLELAALAPSSHNVQPWRVEILDRYHWTLRHDPSRALPAVDPEGREMWLSLGCFVENLDHAARNRGLRMETAVTGSPADGVVDIRFVQDRSVSAGIPDRVLRARRTVRKGFLPTPVTALHARELTDGLDGASLVAPGTAQAETIGGAVVAATARQNADPEAMKELSEWIHWSNRDAAARRDGLTPATMDMTGAAGLFVRLFFSKETVLSDSFAEKGNAIARAQAAENGGWMLLEGGAELADLVDAGRRFERLALRACRLGIGVHPMSQPLEEESWRGALAGALGTGPLQFLLRLGYLAQYPEPVSLRRPIPDFVSLATGTPCTGAES